MNTAALGQANVETIVYNFPSGVTVEDLNEVWLEDSLTAGEVVAVYDKVCFKSDINNPLDSHQLWQLKQEHGLGPFEIQRMCLLNRMFVFVHFLNDHKKLVGMYLRFLKKYKRVQEICKI